MQKLVAEWCPDEQLPQVPTPVLFSVVADPIGDGGPGRVKASGPADATVGGALERDDADVEAAKQAQFINAFSEDYHPGASDSSASLDVAALIQQLEELDHAAQSLCINGNDTVYAVGADDEGEGVLSVFHIEYETAQLAPQGIFHPGAGLMCVLSHALLSPKL